MDRVSFHLLLMLLIVFLLHDQPLASPAPTTGFRATLTHVDSAGSFTLAERFQRAVRRSHRRRQHLEFRHHQSRAPDVSGPLEFDSFEYLLHLAIGSPPFPITAILDTGSDLIWTQSFPCFECLPQPSPYFDPSYSSSFALLPCNSPTCGGIATRCTLYLCQYNTSYGDGTITQGFLATETLTFGRDAVKGVTVGCAMAISGSLSNSTGIVGMGRGLLSLPSQLHPRKFSYCLTLFDSPFKSHLFMGAKASLGTPSGVLTTPIIHNPRIPTFYYLLLNGISVGKTLLPLPRNTFQIRADGTGGILIDSGSFLTSLEKAPNKALKEELISQAHLPVASKVPAVLQSIGLELCFSWTSAKLPRMPDVVFHFAGADMRFPRDKYMVYVEEFGVICSTFAEGKMFSILGNYQQQDLHLLFDLEANLLSFISAKCEKL